MGNYDDLQRNMDRVAAIFAAAGLPVAEAQIENNVVLSWPGASPYVVVYDDQIEVNVFAFNDGQPLWSVSVGELVARADDLVSLLREAIGGVAGS